MPSRTLLATLSTLALLASGAAFAETKDLDKAAQDPSYEAKPVICKGGNCRSFVINDKGIGVIVKGKDKKKTKKKAEKKAKELNEEAEEGTVSKDDDGVFDTCLQFPEMC